MALRAPCTCAHMLFSEMVNDFATIPRRSQDPRDKIRTFFLLFRRIPEMDNSSIKEFFFISSDIYLSIAIIN